MDYFLVFQICDTFLASWHNLLFNVPAVWEMSIGKRNESHCITSTALTESETQRSLEPGQQRRWRTANGFRCLEAQDDRYPLIHQGSKSRVCHKPCITLGIKHINRHIDQTCDHTTGCSRGQRQSLPRPRDSQGEGRGGRDGLRTAGRERNPCCS